MSLVVHHNVAARFARMHLERAQVATGGSAERLSSGERINRAADDTTAYAMAIRFKSDVNGYDVVRRNSRNGMNLIQAMEGTTEEMIQVLTRMRELSTKSATDSMTNNDRIQVQIEYTALQNELQRLSQTTHMNEVQGLAISDTMTFQVGLGGGAANQVVLSLNSMTIAALSLQAANSDVSTLTAAQTALDQISVALDRLATNRSRMGATFRALEASFGLASADSDALMNTISVIRDTDYAEESTALAQNQIRTQAAVSVLTQANTIPQLALQLLGG